MLANFKASRSLDKTGNAGSQSEDGAEQRGAPCRPLRTQNGAMKERLLYGSDFSLGVSKLRQYLPYSPPKCDVRIE